MDGRRVFSTSTSLVRLTEESLPVRYPREQSISLMKDIRVGLLEVGSGHYSLGIAFAGEEVVQWDLVVLTDGYHIATTGSLT